MFGNCKPRNMEERGLFHMLLDCTERRAAAEFKRGESRVHSSTGGLVPTSLRKASIASPTEFWLVGTGGVSD